MKLASVVLTAAVVRHMVVLHTVVEVEGLHTVVEVEGSLAVDMENGLAEVAHRIDLVEVPVEEDSLAEEDIGRLVGHRSLAVGSSWVGADVPAVAGMVNDLEAVGSLVVGSLVEEEDIVVDRKEAADRSLYTQTLAISSVPSDRHVPPP